MNLKSDGTADGDLGLIPLSSAQYGMWLADHVPGGPAVNIAHCVEIKGPVDYDAFTRAVNDGGHETESLVVRVVESDGRPYQFVDRSIIYDEPVLDFSDAEDPVGAAMEWMRRDYNTKAVDLSRTGSPRRGSSGSARTTTSGTAARTIW
ncbi:condensation domain-containing protein [Nocardia asiatica]|uniref:condensation domain-containing protein n=1 Tax=Nocardia asiatica TaxID=209252 RepID=UPI003EDFA667